MTSRLATMVGFFPARKVRWALALVTVWQIGLTATTRAQNPSVRTVADSTKRIDEVLEAKLRDEAPKAWEQLARFYDHVRGSYATSRTSVPENKSANDRMTERAEFGISGDLVKKTQEVKPKGAPLERVKAQNGVYAFSVSKRAGEEQAPFVIEWLEKMGSSPKTDERIAFESDQTKALVRLSWVVLGQSIPEWQKSSSFAITGITSTASGGCRVDFEGMRIGPDQAPSLLGGHVVFDPADYWVVREYLVNMPKGWIRDGVYDYARGENGFPILTKLTENWRKGSDRTVDTMTLDVRHEIVPPEEFKLSFYGLPEPNFSRSGSYALWLALISAGIGCVIIFLLVRRKRMAA
jgi:hypothetical protein